MNRLETALLITLAFLVAFVIGLVLAPYGVDWTEIYRPVTLEAFTNSEFDPYDGTGFFNAPWALYFTIPFALFPPDVGRALWFAFSFTCFLVFALRIRFGPLALGLFLVSPPVIASLWDGNIDGLVLLGAVLPPWIGIPILFIKPQIGIGVIFFYALELMVKYRHDPSLMLDKFFNYYGVFLAVLISTFPAMGFWPAAWLEAPNLGWSVPFWPWGTFVGAFFMLMSYASLDKNFALAAAPFLSPYVAMQSLGGILAPFRKRPEVIFVINLVLWTAIIKIAMST